MSYETITLTIPAGGGQTIARGGSFMRVLYATSPVWIDFDDANTAGMFEQGIGLGGVEFDKFRVENRGADPVNVTIATSRGQISDSRAWLSAALGTAAPESAAVEVGASATLIAAANAGRRALTILNNGGSTLYIGGPGVTAADGFPLEPGAAYPLTNTSGAVYGITAGGTLDVRTLEES